VINLKKEKKGLRIFDITRDGKGLSKNDNIKKSGFKRFFITFKDNFGKLFSVNILFVVGNFPLFFLIMVLSGVSKIEAMIPTSDIFQNLSAIFMNTPPNPGSMTLYALEGINSLVMVNTPLTYVFYGISLLALLTFGIVNVGSAYVLRNIAMGEPVFVFSDFLYAIKRNWKQALPFGVIDGLINALLIFNVFTTLTSGGTVATSLMLWSNIVLFIIYFFMRSYIYIQMVTFKLTVFKMIKNALIFSLLGIKRNLISLLGCAALLLLELMFLFGLGGLLMPLAVGLPLLMLISTMAYIKVFCAYFKIEEIMIVPYKQEHPEEFEEENEVEQIMRDDVTQQRKLDEIKAKR
jgi:uncharacterized membrane protein YesL